MTRFDGPLTGCARWSPDSRLLVFDGGGFIAFEDREGGYLYYSKFEGGGIWRMQLPSGAPEKVVDELRPEMWGNWALSRRGIYWMHFTGESEPTVIRFQPFGGKPRDLSTLPRRRCDGMRE